jgi:hypothetical protein
VPFETMSERRCGYPFHDFLEQRLFSLRLRAKSLFCGCTSHRLLVPPLYTRRRRSGPLLLGGRDCKVSARVATGETVQVLREYRSTAVDTTCHAPSHYINDLFVAFETYKLVSCYQRFRSEYRVERKLQFEDDPSDESKAATALMLVHDDDNSSSALFSISKVVVLYNDSLQTLTCSSANDFDNDSFWQGSITWY